MAWNEGYVSDIEYPAYFFARQSPAHLNFACILNGFEPIPLDQPFTYLELGCGRGLTSNILAASNPQGRFYAVDFNAAYIAGAQQLANAAGLHNLTLLESSFAELAESQGVLPQFDFITLHGIYTWISPENRRHVVNLMARYLKPGGIVYVGYNAMPGWASAMPLQRLLLELANLYPTRHLQIEQGRQFVDRLIGMKAGYFTDNATPPLQKRLDRLRKDDPKYLAHEYLTQHWQPLYHADVARAFADAKLDYVGSARLERAFPELRLTQEQCDLLASVPDETLRETVHDYMLNTQFRHDIFVRGAQRMTFVRQTEWLQQTGVALTAQREDIMKNILLPDISPEMQKSLISIVDSLLEAPRTLRELAELPPLKGMSLMTVAKSMIPYIDPQQAVPYFICSADMDSTPAQRMNRAIAERSRLRPDYRALASSFLGSGIKVGLPHLSVYRALGQKEVDMDALIDEIWESMTARRNERTPDEKHYETPEEVAETVATILERNVPFWCQGKVL